MKVFFIIFARLKKDPDPYLILLDPDPDPRGPKTYGSATLFRVVTLSKCLDAWTARVRSRPRVFAPPRWAPRSRSAAARTAFKQSPSSNHLIWGSGSGIIIHIQDRIKPFFFTKNK
jgi:hypothetical protein